MNENNFEIEHDVDTDLFDDLPDAPPGDMAAANAGPAVAVQTYDGYQAGETPRKVLVNGREYRVLDVLGRSRVRRADNDGDEEHFKVDLDVYGEADIVYHHSWDGWTLKDMKSKKTFTDIFLEAHRTP